MPGSRLVGISVRYAFWPPIKLSNYHQVPLIRDEAVIVTLKHSTIPRFFQDYFYAVFPKKGFSRGYIVYLLASQLESSTTGYRWLNYTAFLFTMYRLVSIVSA